VLNSHGFEGSYDFFYSPCDLNTCALVGYAIINFVSADAASRFFKEFTGFAKWDHSGCACGERPSIVTWNDLQGTKSLVDKYRNGAVMHPAVKDCCKPIVFENGYKIPFPLPTQRVRFPPLQKN